MSPGVLYNAIRVVQPDRVLVICSKQSKTSAKEAANHAGFKGPLASVVMVEPQSGYTEIRSVVDQYQEFLLGADSIAFNLTGGTTMMGLAVQRLFEKAKSLQRSARRFVLIDRRLPQEQSANPWVNSEYHWIEGGQEGEEKDV